jgi:hypothetical protein
MSDKICPIYKAAGMIAGGTIDVEDVGGNIVSIALELTCDGEKCQWWDGTRETCAIYCLVRLHELQGFGGGK